MRVDLGSYHLALTATDGQMGSMGFISPPGCGLPSLVPQQLPCKKLLQEAIGFLFAVRFMLSSSCPVDSS